MRRNGHLSSRKVEPQMPSPFLGYVDAKKSVGRRSWCICPRLLTPPPGQLLPFAADVTASTARADAMRGVVTATANSEP